MSRQRVVGHLGIVASMKLKRSWCKTVAVVGERKGGRATDVEMHITVFDVKYLSSYLLRQSKKISFEFSSYCSSTRVSKIYKSQFSTFEQKQKIRERMSFKNDDITIQRLSNLYRHYIGKRVVVKIFDTHLLLLYLLLYSSD